MEYKQILHIWRNKNIKTEAQMEAVIEPQSPKL